MEQNSWDKILGIGSDNSEERLQSKAAEAFILFHSLLLPKQAELYRLLLHQHYNTEDSTSMQSKNNHCEESRGYSQKVNKDYKAQQTHQVGVTSIDTVVTITITHFDPIYKGRGGVATHSSCILSARSKDAVNGQWSTAKKVKWSKAMWSNSKNDGQVRGVSCRVWCP